ncbi:hypothetical protein [Adonisia turfae]
MTSYRFVPAAGRLVPDLARVRLRSDPQEKPWCGPEGCAVEARDVAFYHRRVHAGDGKLVPLSQAKVGKTARRKATTPDTATSSSEER